ncbi:hypothetical protein BDZ85DRAFT_75462 [Elsinoe ampelina]|uniref:Erythromycin esterase n=1 Tax=Elsinoe ampelina TaxID=302913 RepID=A0A6A6GK06_9PEZI|nr:hypothetical protein BDZ85DRAFT_75462 [Elsinoe ampelina]
MARRSSARIRARKSSTPQPQKNTDLYQDGQLRTPKTAPQLASVAESEEMPGAFPKDDSPSETPTKLARHIADAVAGKARTPKNKAPRPSLEEMHPEHFHQSTSKPLDEARWLGISAMGPHTEKPKASEKWTPAAHTPTKHVKHAEPSFEFTFRAQSLELSNEARKMMAEKREEAAKIKQQMVRIEEEKQEEEALENRRKAKPKGKVGRFSDVHMAQFKKMDSIANHASVSRPNSRDVNQDFRPSSRDRMQDVRPNSRNGSDSNSGGKSKVQYPSLKRSGSRAGLKQGGRDTEDTPSHERQRTQPTPDKTSQRPSPEEGGSPAKRVRLASPKTTLPVQAQSVIKVATPSVMQKSHGTPSRSNSLKFPGLSTPTKSSLARAATVKANKTSMIPALTRTPSKSASKAPPSQVHAGNSLLARSPTKFAHMSAKKEAPRADPGSPLLSRSPSKALFADRLVAHNNSDSEATMDKAPLLSRSPMRVPKELASDSNDEGLANKIPLLARTPAKPAMDSNPFSALPTSTAPNSNLMDRFKLLRKSPIKSILRTPQRLYSTDPNKIAAGTHLATPPTVKAHAFADLPTMSSAANRGGVSFHNPPATAPVPKHVDFSASTKSDDESPVPSSRNIIYPSLPPRDKPSKETKRRQTLGPLAMKDFTFRADVGQGIIFGPSPSAQKHSPKPSIRHVSAEPALPSPGTALGGIERKRKFVEEDDVFAPTRSAPGAYAEDDEDADVDMADKSQANVSSDKENDSSYANILANIPAATGKGKAKLDADFEADPRPTKRVKTAPGESLYPSLPTQTTAPKGAERSATHVPIWAKGTAAQKARASIAKKEVERKRVGTLGNRPKMVGGGAVKKFAGVMGSKEGHGSAAKETREASRGREGSEEKPGEGKEEKKGVLSRARLDALSQPKRRVGV